MKVIVIVNDSPWGSVLPVAALRLVRAMLSAGQAIDAVFFRGDGAYNARPGRGSDTGTPDLYQQWASLAGKHGFPLLVCSASAARRLDSAPGHGFREAGLADVMERIEACDRVVSF